MDATQNPTLKPRALATSRRVRPRRSAVVVAAALIAILATACHSRTAARGVATVSSPTASTSSAPSSTGTGAPVGRAAGQGGGQTSSSGFTVAYSRCMRSHNVPNFPDPDSQGQITISNSTNGIDPHSTTFQAAQTACQTTLRGHGTGARNPQQQAQAQAAVLRYAQCMRSHGLPNFPDPDSHGGISINSSSGIDPASSGYKAAQQVCGPILGANGSSGSGS